MNAQGEDYYAAPSNNSYILAEKIELRVINNRLHVLLYFLAICLVFTSACFVDFRWIFDRKIGARCVLNRNSTTVSFLQVSMGRVSNLNT